jgi:histidine ammonia-lyase
MGANAVTKLIKVVENVYSILGIELINASQAMSYRAPSKSNLLIEFIDEFRQKVALVNRDRLLSPDLWNARNFLQNIEIEHKEFLPQF